MMPLLGVLCMLLPTSVTLPVSVCTHIHVQDPPRQGEEMEVEGEVWREPPSPYSISYLGPQTPSFFPPPSPYSYLDPSLEVAPPPPLYPPTLGMGPWTAVQPLVCFARVVVCCVVGSGCHCAVPPVPCASVGVFLVPSIPMVPVGSPSGRCLPFPCVQWSRSTCTADSFHPTHCSDGTFTTDTGVCACVCVCVLVPCLSVFGH